MLMPNFSLEELTFSSTAVRLGIDNTPSDNIVEHLKIAAAGMEDIRALLGSHGIHVDSGYRCPSLNYAVKGAAYSAHLNGYAVDFICPAYGSPQQIVDTLIASPLQFDQIIQEGTWVHASFDPQLRRRVLTAHFGPNGTTYSEGA